MGSRARAISIILFRIIIAVTVVMLFSISKPSLAATPVISWTPGGITVTVATGDSAEVDVKFSSKIKLNNATLFIVPELQPFITITPSSFASISAGAENSVRLAISIPPTTPLGIYDGTVHLRVANRTYPQTLKVTLQVGQAISSQGGTVTSSDGLATVNIPPGAIPIESLYDDDVITVTIIPTSDTPPAGFGTAIGTSYDFGPSGYEFSRPVTITMQYDPFKIPSGVPETHIRVAMEVNGQWVGLPDSIVDTINHQISGRTNFTLRDSRLLNLLTKRQIQNPISTL